MKQKTISKAKSNPNKKGNYYHEERKIKYRISANKEEPC